MTIAYLRVGTAKQYLNEQQDEIKQFATDKRITIDKWVTDIVGDRSKEVGDNLDLVVDRIGKGDILIVSDVSRIGRTLAEVMDVLARCFGKGAFLYSIKDRYILDDKLDLSVVAGVCSMAASIEHSLMSNRTREALSSRKSVGRPLGRPKGSDAKQSLLDENKEEIINMLERRCTVMDICKRFNVSRNTYYAFKKNYKF